uniref:Putative secreted protein n=1 Tax=Anopheles marajoara TaxID=58244 RepID=A0A2M4C5M6_9DIPT
MSFFISTICRSCSSTIRPVAVVVVTLLLWAPPAASRCWWVVVPPLPTSAVVRVPVSTDTTVSWGSLVGRAEIISIPVAVRSRFTPSADVMMCLLLPTGSPFRPPPPLALSFAFTISSVVEPAPPPLPVAARADITLIPGAAVTGIRWPPFVITILLNGFEDSVDRLPTGTLSEVVVIAFLNSLDGIRFMLFTSPLQICWNSSGDSILITLFVLSVGDGPVP